MRFTLWRRYPSDVESEQAESEQASSESAAACALSTPVRDKVLPFRRANNNKRKYHHSKTLERLLAGDDEAAERLADCSSDDSYEPPTTRGRARANDEPVSSEVVVAAPTAAALRDSPDEEEDDDEDPLPTRGALVRGARGLVARVRSMAQSIDELKDRLFFDTAEAEARSREFDDMCDALDEAAEALEDDELSVTAIEAVRNESRTVQDMWAHSDDLTERLRARCLDMNVRPALEGWARKVRVRRVGADGDPALRGQFECVAATRINKGERAPYPGVVVASLDEQRALLAPLRPVDRTKWACFSYSFSSHLDGSEDFCTELWPVLDAPTTYINDACGPVDRSVVKMAARQNVEYVETLSSSPSDWRVDVLALRDIGPGEPLLADYGDAYWQNWREHVHTRTMKRLDQRIADVFAMRVHEKSNKSARGKVRIETRVDNWLRLATKFCNQSKMKKPAARNGRRRRTPTPEEEEESSSEESAAPATPRPTIRRQPPSTAETVVASPPSKTPRPIKPRPDASMQRPASMPRTLSWRDKMGRRVVSRPRGRGYQRSVGVAVRVATERDSWDPMLQALYETALGGPAIFEAWWDDGQPYPLLTLDPRPRASRDLWARNAYFDVHFIDGEHAQVERVAPILNAMVWRRLERLPIGSWCRPLQPKHDRWGVIVNYTFSNDAFTYHVRMDDAADLEHFTEPEIEPIVIVRGTNDAGSWQEATPVSLLNDIGDADVRSAFGA